MHGSGPAVEGSSEFDRGGIERTIGAVQVGEHDSPSVIGQPRFEHVAGVEPAVQNIAAAERVSRLLQHEQPAARSRSVRDSAGIWYRVAKERLAVCLASFFS